MTLNFRGALVLPVLYLALAAGAAHAVEGEMWEMTVSMKMAGMEMPAQTQRVCTPKGQQEKAMQPEKSDCVMQDMKRSGNRSTFTVSCQGGQLIGNGEFVSNGPNANSGSMRMKGKMDGQAMDMTQTWSGKKLGPCEAIDTAAAVAAAQKQGADAQAQTCKAMLQAHYWQGFDKGGPCEKQRKEFCADMSSTLRTMSTAEGYAKHKGGNGLEDALGFCGLATTNLLPAACKDGMATSNWNFIGDNCPTEAQALAATHCEGRSYTVVMSGPYGGICQRYAADRWNSKRASAGGTPSAADATDTLIKEGTSKLKGLLGF